VIPPICTHFRKKQPAHLFYFLLKTPYDKKRIPFIRSFFLITLLSPFFSLPPCPLLSFMLLSPSNNFCQLPPQITPKHPLSIVWRSLLFYDSLPRFALCFLFYTILYFCCRMHLLVHLINGYPITPLFPPPFKTLCFKVLLLLYPLPQ